MIAEAIAKLVGLGQDAQRVEFHTHPNLPNRVFVRNGDELVEHLEPVPRRMPKLEGMQDLVSYLESSAALAPEIYLHHGKVEAFLDREDRRSVATVELLESERFRIVTALESGRSMTPKEAVRFLRLELPDTGTAGVVQALSRIDFTRSSSGRSDVAHGKESLGRAVEASVQQAADVPERFAVRVPVWTSPGFDEQVQIEVGVYLDLVEERVHLRTLPDQISRALSVSMSRAFDALVKQLPNVPIYCGRIS